MPRFLSLPHERAEEMGRLFHANDSLYQSDEKWWELIQETDRQLLTGASGVGGVVHPAGEPPPLEGFPAPGVAEQSANAPPVVSPPPETAIPSLSREYRSEPTGPRWDVRALHVEAAHPLLADTNRPWALQRQTSGEYKFLINIDHPIFASATMTPLDGLLAELAWSAMDFLRGNEGTATFAGVLAELRERYATAAALDPVSLATEARQVLAAVAAALPHALDAQDARALFNELAPADHAAILQKMAARRAPDPQGIINQGRFLEYAPPRLLLDFFSAHPELFLDGKCWDDGYGTLDYTLPSATEAAQQQVVRHYESLLVDALWLAEQESAELGAVNRARLLRAQLALDMLAPTGAGVIQE